MPNLIDIIKSYLTNVALVGIAEAINLGRSDAFADLEEHIAYFSWSAILDFATCPICDRPERTPGDFDGLDGLNFSPRDPLLDYIRPPIHQSCRCILVAVLREEAETFPADITTLTFPMVRRVTRNKYWMPF